LKDKVKEVKLGVACSRHAREERCMQSFSGEPEGTTPLGRQRHNICD